MVRLSCLRDYFSGLFEDGSMRSAARRGESMGVIGPVRVRRYDIDWLRIAAVLLLIPFHTARVFNVAEAFYSKNPELSTALQRFIFFVQPWHMSLLFFLAGAASWFALGFRKGGQYAGERLKRLMVPFLFGLVIIVPPQAYCGMLTNTTADRSWWSQYAYFWTHWADPQSYDGMWTPAHLWFILFLFVYSLLALGVILWLRRGGRRFIDWFAGICRYPAVVIVLPTIPLLIDKSVDPMGDLSGQTPIGFFLLFVLGCFMVADERIVAAVDRHWRWVLPLGIVCMAVRAGLWPHTEGWPNQSWQDTLVNWLMYEFGVWMMIVGLLGLCHRYVNGTNRLYGYATEAAYPFYILHQTVIVLLAYLVVQWGFGIPLKYTVIAVSSFCLTLAIYEVAVRRWGVVRFFFGMKPKRKRTVEAVPAGHVASPVR
jgi:glucan biosynthesis protein C